MVGEHRARRGRSKGGSISPLLANLYLHYVFDRWIQRWRRKRAHGDVSVVRFADDFIVGFEHRYQAEQFLAALRERFAKFGLELHPDKTRLVEFGRWAVRDRQRRGQRRPETFNFLGCVHSCTTTKKGRFAVLRQTMRKRMQAKLHEVKAEWRRPLHTTIPEQGAYLRAVVQGHMQYYGVPRNGPALIAFGRGVARLWWQQVNRRSQGRHVSWGRMTRYIRRFLPPARICHPYPTVRRIVTT